MDNVTLIRVVAGLMAMLFFVPVYFLPSLIAWKRKRNLTAIFIVNLLAGWTVLAGLPRSSGRS
jgi:DMSO reductase anchor subunit